MKLTSKSNISGFLILVALVSATTWFAVSPTVRAGASLDPENTSYGANALGEGGSAGDGLNCAFGVSTMVSDTYGSYNTAIGAFALAYNDGNYNTATGFEALYLNTSGGSNTATGFEALYSNTTGYFNTANGSYALSDNTTGYYNTATGFGALQQNTTGSQNTTAGFYSLFSNKTGVDNTADGYEVLFNNTNGNYNTGGGWEALWNNASGSYNTADGHKALWGNTSGVENTATGAYALLSNTIGYENTATGDSALNSNTSGIENTAAGFKTLLSNTTGGQNTASGWEALLHSTGSNNIALGASAGSNLTTGSNNIDIGALGNAGESNTIRIGKGGVQTHAYIQGIHGVTASSGVPVIVTSNGQLGTTTSSARFKDDIKPMDKASEAVLGLKPVTFRYKKDLDPDGIPQFGLVAEQVEKVDPNLVVRDEKGQVYTVRYEAVNAMLLNEFLKEHKKVEDQEATIRQLSSMVAEQQKVLAASLKQQNSKIQAINEQLERVIPLQVADSK